MKYDFLFTFRKKMRYVWRIVSAYLFQRHSSNLSFWHTQLRVNLLGDDDLKSLRRYPQNFEDKIGLISSVDACGVIMLDYKGDLGHQYNPNAIAQLALGYYDKIVNGEDCVSQFIEQAAYFIQHGRIVDDVLLWEYNFPFEVREGVHSPWRSALAQGQGISVCLRAFQLTGDERYFEAATRAFNAFRYDAGAHPAGVLDSSLGYIWLEEYILYPPTHVLNGFVWALWGVREYAVFMGDEYAWMLWDKCVDTLKRNLMYYDLGFWSSYDLVKLDAKKRATMPVSSYYQRLHVVQMKAMYHLTGDREFDGYAERWARQFSNPVFRSVALIWKIYFKLRWF